MCIFFSELHVLTNGNNAAVQGKKKKMYFYADLFIGYFLLLITVAMSPSLLL